MTYSVAPAPRATGFVLRLILVSLLALWLGLAILSAVDLAVMADNGDRQVFIAGVLEAAVLLLLAPALLLILLPLRRALRLESAGAPPRMRRAAFLRSVLLPPAILVSSVIGAILLAAARCGPVASALGVSPGVLLEAQVMLLLLGAATCLWLGRVLRPQIRRLWFFRAEQNCALCRLRVQPILWTALLVLLVSGLAHYTELAARANFAGLPQEGWESVVTRQQVSLAVLLLAGVAMGWVLGGEASRPIQNLTRRLEVMNAADGPVETELPIDLAAGLGAVEKAFNRLSARLQADLSRLQEFTERISQSDRSRSRFLAGFSHELRTPLNSIIGYSDLFISGMAGELNPEAREYLQIILQEGETLLDIINRLLYLSRLDAGREQLESRPTSVAELRSQIDARIEQPTQKPLWRLTGLSDGNRVLVDANKISLALAALGRLERKGEAGMAPVFELGAEGEGLRLKVSLCGYAEKPSESTPDVYWLLAQSLAEKVAQIHGGRCQARQNDHSLTIEILLPGALASI